jgi:hypothetical protein
MKQTIIKPANAVFVFIPTQKVKHLHNAGAESSNLYGCGSHMAGNSLRDDDLFTGSVSHPSSKLYSASSLPPSHYPSSE